LATTLTDDSVIAIVIASAPNIGDPVRDDGLDDLFAEEMRRHIEHHHRQCGAVMPVEGAQQKTRGYSRVFLSAKT
jgi:hypothetical protein